MRLSLYIITCNAQKLVYTLYVGIGGHALYDNTKNLQNGELIKPLYECTIHL